MPSHALVFLFFFFNDTATTEIYTLSLHDALPISVFERAFADSLGVQHAVGVSSCTSALYLSLEALGVGPGEDRKSTRLNSSHSQISYAVFCLKKKQED